MKKEKKKALTILIIIILILLGALYWLVIGPSLFRKKCDKMFPSNTYWTDPESGFGPLEAKGNYDLYMDCLRAREVILEDPYWKWKNWNIF